MSDTDIAARDVIKKRFRALGLPTSECVRGANEVLHALEQADLEVVTKAEIKRLRAGRAADPEAMEAAKRIKRFHKKLGGPVNYGGIDADTVATALLASATSRAAVWAECRETCAKEADRFVRARHGALAVDIRDAIHALEVPNE